MDINILIEMLPDSVKEDIVDFQDVILNNGLDGMRIVLDRLLTQEEKEMLKATKRCIGVDCVATYKYAPEIKRSYFYISY